MQPPDFIDDAGWWVLPERAREFQGSWNLYVVPEIDEIFLVAVDFTLWRWLPGDGCFMQALALGAGR